MPGSRGLFLKPIAKCFLLLLQKACVFFVVVFKPVLVFSLLLSKCQFTKSGAHNPERSTAINSCNGVFTSEFIFR